MSRAFRVTFLAPLALLSGCVLGNPGPPGCQEDAECGAGFSCRAGACLREKLDAPLAPDAGAGEGGAGGAP